MADFSESESPQAKEIGIVTSGNTVKIGVLAQPLSTVNIEELHIEQDSIAQRPRDEQKLIRKVQAEISDFLQQRLHAYHINLYKQAMPHLVTPIQDVAADGFSIREEHDWLQSNTPLIEIFNHPEIQGELLITGEPGVGKTIELVSLARALLETLVIEDSSYPIPVLFNLASWKPGQTITQWLIAEFKTRDVPKKIAQQLLQSRMIIPLLDGLDELKTVDQPDCVEALNRFLVGERGEQNPPYTLVCCRSEEYAELEVPLCLNGAIQLQPLTPKQVQAYLSELGESELWQLASQDPEVMNLLKTPLLLSVNLCAYKEMSAEEWESLRQNENRQQILWDAYIRGWLKLPFEENGSPSKTFHTNKQSRKYLIWLAQKLSEYEQTEFLIEGLQPRYLHNASAQKRYFLIVSCLIGLTFWIVWTYAVDSFLEGTIAGVYIGIGSYIMRGKTVINTKRREWLGLLYGALVFLFSGLIYALFGRVSDDLDLIDGLTDGLIAGFFVGFGNWATDEIRPFDRIRWNWKAARSRAWKIGWLSFLGICLIVFLGSVSGLFKETIGLTLLEAGMFGLLMSILMGLIMGALGFFLGGISGKSIEDKDIPNQAIRQSARSALIVGIGFMFFCEILLGPLWWFSEGSMLLDPTAALIAGLFFGGGMACVQHLLLRLFLYKEDHIPWNYARFLDYCTQQRLLQRIGGRYRFIHKFLQQHFANM